MLKEFKEFMFNVLKIHVYRVRVSFYKTIYTVHGGGGGVGYSGNALLDPWVFVSLHNTMYKNRHTATSLQGATSRSTYPRLEIVSIKYFIIYSTKSLIFDW